MKTMCAFQDCVLFVCSEREYVCIYCGIVASSGGRWSACCAFDLFYEGVCVYLVCIYHELEMQMCAYSSCVLRF